MTIALILSVALRSTLIALGGLILAHRLRRHAARSRVFVLRLTFLALAACVATAAAPPLISVAWPAPPLAKASAQPDVQATIAMPLTPVLDGVLTARWSPPSPAFLAALPLYGLGVAATGAPLIAGLCLLKRWSREATPVTGGMWMETLQQLAPLTRTRLATSAAIQSPLSWGAAPSWILIDPVTLGRPDCAPSVLAHELAHTRAGDWASADRAQEAADRDHAAAAIAWALAETLRLDASQSHLAARGASVEAEASRAAVAANRAATANL
jgi:hypothetical protein